MSNDTALYHLAKAVGLYKEIEKHLEALSKLGIEVSRIDDSKYIFVENGIENFGMPLEEGKVKTFEFLGIEVIG